MRCPADRIRSFQRVDIRIGSLRGYLCRSLSNFILSWQQRESHPASITQAEPLDEPRLDDAANEALSPEEIYDRKWVETILERVLHDLGSHYRSSNRSELFAALEPFLRLGALLRNEDLTVLASRLNKSEAAVSVAMSRLRRDFVLMLRREVRRTVASDDAMKEELAYLWSLFRTPV